MLTLDKLSKTYRVGTFGNRELRAVHEVSFEVADGEVVSLIGESGSGKSTIGRMILRLLPVSSGGISFDGSDVAGLRGPAVKEYYRRVQGVFQDPFSSYNPIFKADRVFQVIKEEFFPQVPGSEWDARVAAALQSVGLNPGHVLGKFPHQLSGGQLQRFLIARALLLDIRFLVADEIISMLDASTRMDVLNLLADLKARGLSILFITHDLSLGYYLSDKSVILYRGRVVELGPTVELYRNPRHPYTQMLMNAVPRMDKKWEAGSPDLGARSAEADGGCPYTARCPLADTACRQAPDMQEVEPGHTVACWRETEREGRRGKLSI
jgi:peptide/nickel transport system ATP-binding protein